MFEMHPLVASYQEQPSEEIYYDELGEARTCYPDFLLRLVNGGEVLIEVKRGIDLERPKIAKKLQLIALRFSEQKRPYRILTEKEIRREPLHGNLQRLWQAARATRIDISVHTAVDALSHQQLYTHDELLKIVNNEQVIYALIASGRLRTDLEKTLNQSSKVWTAFNQEAGDGSFFL